MDFSNQWEFQGDCNECRKKKYCSKSCKAHDKYVDRKISQAINNTTFGKMVNAFNDAIGISDKY
jgi:radical SAM protein with 4Fe4S-binding SPASM domain